MTTTEQTATAAPEITCVRDYIVYLCSTPNGATCTEIGKAIDRTTRQVTSHLTHMIGQGRIFKGQRGGMQLRFFTEAANRDAWQLAKGTGNDAQTVVRQQYMPRLVAVDQHIVSRARKPGGAPLLLPGSIPFRRNKGTVPAPVDINSDQFKLVGDMVMRADAVHTICPSSTHDPRYQLGPADSVEKLFSAAPPGHYLADPSPWAAAAIQARG